MRTINPSRTRHSATNELHVLVTVVAHDDDPSHSDSSRFVRRVALDLGAIGAMHPDRVLTELTDPVVSRVKGARGSSERGVHTISGDMVAITSSMRPSAHACHIACTTATDALFAI
jgi:hypothetical protein